jgi:hypothetical protein
MKLKVIHAIITIIAIVSILISGACRYIGCGSVAIKVTTQLTTTQKTLLCEQSNYSIDSITMDNLSCCNSNGSIIRVSLKGWPWSIGSEEQKFEAYLESIGLTIYNQ